MGRAERVHNTTSAKRVRTVAGKTPSILPKAHASMAVANTQPQINSSNPVERFLGNVARGAHDTGRSYTTDIVDTVTGDYEERSIQDQTLFDAFASSALEGNLDPALKEAGRRITQEPGRVVGEVAVEAGFMVGTMGIGAAAKGVKIGATGAKAVRAASKAKGAVGYERKTGIIRKGKEIKFIGDKTTTVKTYSKKKGWQTKTKKTKWTDRIERKALGSGEQVGKKLGTSKAASPMVQGGTIGSAATFKFGKTKVGLGSGKIVKEDTTIGWMKQYEQFQAGQIPRKYTSGKGYDLTLDQQKAGLFKGVADDTRSPAKGVVNLSKANFDTTIKAVSDTPPNPDDFGLGIYSASSTPAGFTNDVQRVGGLADDLTHSSTMRKQFSGVLNPDDVRPPTYQNKEGKTFMKKLDPDERKVANELITEAENKIKKDKGIKQQQERPSITKSKDTREVESIDRGESTGHSFGGEAVKEPSTSPSSLAIYKDNAIKLAKAQVLQTIGEGGTKTEARNKVNEIIKWFRKENKRYDELVTKEKKSLSLSGALGTPVDNVGATSTKFNLIEEAKPGSSYLKTDADGGLVKTSVKGEPDVVALGENFGQYGRSQGEFESATKALNKIGGATDKTARIKDGINVGSASNQFDEAADLKRSLDYFGKGDEKIMKQYQSVKGRIPGGDRKLPADINQYKLKFDFSKKQTEDILVQKGWGGTFADAEKKVAKINPRRGNKTPQTPGIWNKKPGKQRATVKGVRAQVVDEFIAGDMTGVTSDPFVPNTQGWSKKQLKESGITAKQWEKDAAVRLTDPQENVDSIFHSIQFESAPRGTGSAMDKSKFWGNSAFARDMAKARGENPFYGKSTNETKKTVPKFSRIRRPKPKKAKTRIIRSKKPNPEIRPPDDNPYAFIPSWSDWAIR